MIIKKAGIPSQCILNEAFISPCINSVIERPSPQPGHQPMPTFSNGHSVKWCVCGLEKYSSTSAVIQHNSSIGSVENLIARFIVTFYMLDRKVKK